MSTNNIQNYLSNVFRPQLLYDVTAASPYQVKLNMSNINNITAESITTGTINVGDQFGNVYLGSNSGNPPDQANNSSNNIAYGVYAGNANSNVTSSLFVGFAAAPNVSNASNVIALGANTIAGGSDNIYIGTATGSLLGSNNIFLGNSIAKANTNDRFFVGGDGNNIVISADLSNNRVGLLNTDPQYPVEISDYTYISNGLGINADPREHTLNVNGDFYVEDGYGYFTFDHDEVTSNTIVTFGSYTPGKTAIVSVCGDLFVEGSINISGTYSQSEVDANIVRISTLLDVSSGTGNIQSLNVSNMYIKDIFGVDAATIFTSPCNIITAKNITVNGIAQIADLSANTGRVAGDLSVAGMIYGNLSGTVTGAISTTDVNVPGFINVSGTADFFSNTNVGGNLIVSGISTFSNAVNIPSTLNVSLGTTMSNLTVNGLLTNTAGSNLFNNLAATGRMNVSGVSTIYNTLNVFSNGLNVSGISLFNSNVGMKGTLNVSGQTSLYSNVGINVAPASGFSLNVSGISKITPTLILSNDGLTSNSRLLLGPAPGTTNYDYCSMIQSTQNTVGNFGSELSFWTHGEALTSGDPTRVMTINRFQNVGINTANPAFTLDVSGTARVTSTITSLSTVTTIELTAAGTGTITVPSVYNRYLAKIKLIGGGGGGGGGQSVGNSGGGGGGSGYITTIEAVVEKSKTLSFTVGNGGAGALVGLIGNTGGSTTFKSLVAAGGIGGTGATSGQGGLGGNGSFGGGGGRCGGATTSTGGTGTIISGYGGNSSSAGFGGSIGGGTGTSGRDGGGNGGGELTWAGIGGTIITPTTAAATPGTLYGAGGGGGAALNSGAAGAPGAVIIDFYPIV